MTKLCCPLFYFVLVFCCTSCSTTKTQNTSDVALDYILGHVRDTLVESKNSYSDLVSTLLAETSLKPEVKKKLSRHLLEFFNGGVLYRKVQDYYSRSLGQDFFAMAVTELSHDGPQKLHAKERLDLNPNNYQEFIKSRPAFSDWNEREDIIDSFDDLNKVSGTLMASFHNMHQVLITAIAIAGTPPSEVQDLDQSLQRLEGNIQLQTVHFIKEAMKYTYQDFTKEELLLLKRFYERPMMRQIFDRVEEAIGQAYASQLGVFKAAYKP